MYQPKFNFFVDLDGVLADFDRGFMEFCGSTLPLRETDRRAGWEAIKRTPKFWANLPLMPGALALWDLVQAHNPIILTSPSFHDEARARVGKKEWVETWLGKDVPILFRRSKDKHLLAAPDAILIDDWVDNISRWRQAGGIGIQHLDFHSTRAEIARHAPGHVEVA